MINTPLILSGLVFSSIGFGYFMFGRRQSNRVARYAGLLLMIYPYFMSDVVIMWLIGMVLMLIPRFVRG